MKPDTLPPLILTAVLELGRALERLVCEHTDGTLVELEQGVLTELRAAGPRLLEAVLTGSQLSLRQSASRRRWSCPRCTNWARVQSWRKRKVLTVVGKGEFERPWCVCPTCRYGWSPTDATLGLTPRARLSPGIEEWTISQGARMSFAEASENLALLTGHVVSKETVRQKTEGRGELFREQDARAAAVVEKTREAAEPVDRAPGALVIETDGVMVPYREGSRKPIWHEVKIGEVFGYQDGKMVEPSYVASRESPREFGPRLVTEAARRGGLEIQAWEGPPTRWQCARLRQVAVVGDGAKWIWGLAEEHFDRRVEILDWYHASQHLWSLARLVFGDGDATREWVADRLRDLREHGSPALLAALRGLRAKGEADQPLLGTEKRYFRSNALRMEYPKVRKLGLPIGSGAIESAAKRLIKQRLDLPGTTWSKDGANRVIAVRCRLLSHRSLAA